MVDLHSWPNLASLGRKAVQQMKNVVYIVGDVEADGPFPYRYSMVELGAVAVRGGVILPKGFSEQIRPMTDFYDVDALSAIGRTRKDCETRGRDASSVMQEFKQWLHSVSEGGSSRLVFVADNAGFDWQFVNFYMHYYLGSNPLGYSCLSLTSLYKGVAKSMSASFKHLRQTKHDHTAINDARGNAEALVEILKGFV